MLLLAMVLCVVALQVGPKLIKEAFVTSFNDPQLNIDADSAWTIHSWVSMYQSTPSCMKSWTLTTSQGELALCKQLTGGFQVCSSEACATLIGVGEEFRWEFVSVSVNRSVAKVCSSPWETRSLTCVSIVSSSLVLGSSSVLTVSAEVEQFDLQLKTEYLSDLTAVT
jgi:hypothetical protein